MSLFFRHCVFFCFFLASFSAHSASAYEYSTGGGFWYSTQDGACSAFAATVPNAGNNYAAAVSLGPQVIYGNLRCVAQFVEYGSTTSALLISRPSACVSPEVWNDDTQSCQSPPPDCSSLAGQQFTGYGPPGYADTAVVDGCAVSTVGVSVSLAGQDYWYAKWEYTGEVADSTLLPLTSREPAPVSEVDNKPDTESVTNTSVDLGCDAAGSCTAQETTTTVTVEGVTVSLESDGITDTLVQDGGVTTIESVSTTNTNNSDGSRDETVIIDVTLTDNGTTTVFSDSSTGEIISEQSTGSTVLNDYSTTTINNYGSNGNLQSSSSSSTGSNPGPSSGNCAPGQKCEVSLEDGEEGIAGPGDPVSWWEPKYPDGINQVFDDFKALHVEQGPLANWMNSWSFPTGGSAPSWTFNVNMGANMNFGSFTLILESWVLAIVRAIMIFSALLAARKIIFGG